MPFIPSFLWREGKHSFGLGRCNWSPLPCLYGAAFFSGTSLGLEGSSRVKQIVMLPEPPVVGVLVQHVLCTLEGRMDLEAKGGGADPSLPSLLHVSTSVYGRRDSSLTSISCTQSLRVGGPFQLRTLPLPCLSFVRGGGGKMGSTVWHNDLSRGCLWQLSSHNWLSL